ncbi:MAG TPA: S28 family serine protease [Prolixibacteraceae bacterium]|jgi:hypothetical protein
MKYYLFLTLCLSLFNTFGQTDKQLLERALFNLPNVSFNDVSKPGDSFLTYDLFVRQPLDHQHPEKGTFNQWVQLRHKGFTKPMVIETHGYQGSKGRNEVEKILDANNVGVEYRFFGKSMPDSLQWEYLTIEQATADLHAIHELLKEIYRGKWISTGISKGGQTTIYYKYFYPDDVQLAVPYVAPMDDNLEDTRIYTFLDTIGTPECRKKILDFQKFLLLHETEAIEKLTWYTKGAGLKFNYTGSIGKSFEYTVLEYPFSFWQWGRSCDSIPACVSVDKCLGELLKVVNISFFSDKDMENFGPHYYQAATQSGYYGYNIAPFRKYLKHFSSNPSALFPPKSATILPSTGELNKKVEAWLKEKGTNILYIYGGIDTWSAARVLVSDKVNSKSFLIPGANHGSARIVNMPSTMQQEFTKLVKSWTGLDCKLDVLKNK